MSVPYVNRLFSWSYSVEYRRYFRPTYRYNIIFCRLKVKYFWGGGFGPEIKLDLGQFHKIGINEINNVGERIRKHHIVRLR
jgi:hypothetical protein